MLPAIVLTFSRLGAKDRVSTLSFSLVCLALCKHAIVFSPFQVLGVLEPVELIDTRCRATTHSLREPRSALLCPVEAMPQRIAVKGNDVTIGSFSLIALVRLTKQCLKASESMIGSTRRNVSWLGIPQRMTLLTLRSRARQIPEAL